MSVVDQAKETQLKNIEKKTGQSREELAALIRASGLSKHGELRAMAQEKLGLGFGDANALVHFALKAPVDGPSAESNEGGEVLDGLYVGPKAALRPIHERLMAAIEGFGPFEAAPKKVYVSLRRKKQFAMVGPATNTRVEVGLNMKGVEATDRLETVPAGGMCQYKVKVTDAAQVDDELIGWVGQAYEAAG